MNKQQSQPLDRLQALPSLALRSLLGEALRVYPITV